MYHLQTREEGREVGDIVCVDVGLERQGRAQWSPPHLQGILSASLKPSVTLKGTVHQGFLAHNTLRAKSNL